MGVARQDVPGTARVAQGRIGFVHTVVNVTADELLLLDVPDGPDRDTALALYGCWTGNPAALCENCGTMVVLVEFGPPWQKVDKFQWAEAVSPDRAYHERVWRTHNVDRCREVRKRPE